MYSRAVLIASFLAAAVAPVMSVPTPASGRSSTDKSSWTRDHGPESPPDFGELNAVLGSLSRREVMDPELFNERSWTPAPTFDHGPETPPDYHKLAAVFGALNGRGFIDPDLDERSLKLPPSFDHGPEIVNFPIQKLPLDRRSFTLPITVDHGPEIPPDMGEWNALSRRESMDPDLLNALDSLAQQLHGNVNKRSSVYAPGDGQGDNWP
ncbi:hypothetical protein JVU11DRAFT_11825 [Chiua virens]|nr:hypothetical protein JVU11DRAFT_11825 [Chiua virens]